MLLTIAVTVGGCSSGVGVIKVLDVRRHKVA